MPIIKWVITVFILLESTNVITLYFFPDTKLANGIGIFPAWNKSKSDPEMHNFVRYLVNWVAGTKLIFILLLVVLLFSAGENTLLLSGGALVLSIASFFWRLFPLIRNMDREDQIEPKNYSAALGWMIAVFVLIFLTATLISI
jgi:hypothetical protein